MVASTGDDSGVYLIGGRVKGEPHDTAPDTAHLERLWRNNTLHEDRMDSISSKELRALKTQLNLENRRKRLVQLLFLLTRSSELDYHIR